MTKIVRAIQTIGTKFTVFSAWEPFTFNENGIGSHSTLTSIDGVRVGRIGTRILQPNPPRGWRIRPEMVDAFLNEQFHEAYALIISEFPDVATGKRDMGQIEVFDYRKA